MAPCFHKLCHRGNSRSPFSWNEKDIFRPSKKNNARSSRAKYFLSRTPLLLFVFISTTAIAQIAPPEFKLVDDQDVNILGSNGGNLDITIPLLSMKSATGEDFSYERYFSIWGSWRDNFALAADTTNVENGTITVIDGTKSHVFSGMYPYSNINGLQYEGDAENNAFNFVMYNASAYPQFISKYGKYINFDNPSLPAIVYPSGLTRRYYIKVADTGSSYFPYGPPRRLQSVVQNDGVLLKYGYESNDYASNPSGWGHVTSVMLVNMAYAYCDPNSDQCGSIGSWPSATFTGPASGVAPSGQTSVETMATNTGFARSYTKDSFGRIIGISNLSDGNNDITISYLASDVDPNGRNQAWDYTVTRITKSNGEIKNYNRNNQIINNQSYNTISDHSSYLNSSRIYISDGNLDNFGAITSIKDRNGNTTQYRWDEPGMRLRTVIYPEGNSEEYGYDGRFNIISKKRNQKPGSNLAATLENTTFDAICVNINTCNLPKSYTNANGGQTNWTYTTFGAMASQLSPPPSAGSPRPLKLFTYIQKVAYVQNANGVLTPTGQPIWLPSTMTDCQTIGGSSALACDSGAPQIVTTYIYGADGTADNLLLKGKAVSAAGVTLLTCFSYDRFRHQISETAPNANLTSCP